MNLFSIHRLYSHTRPFIWALFMTMSGAYAFAQQAGSVSSVADLYPVGSIRSVDDADAALAAATRERTEIEARYQSEELACHPKFFATSCIEQAKERRRQALSVVRPVEVEANTFKRQARLDNRERALAERLANDEKDRQVRASRQNDSEAVAGSMPPPLLDEGGRTEEDYSRKVQATLFPDRSAAHQSKLKRLQAEEAANATKRAKNIAAYEKKKREALERQQKVAQRKAEKERKRKEKQGVDSLPE